MKIKRASTIKRDRRTKTRMAQLDEQIIAVLREDHPQSVRHVFYRMTDPRLGEPVEKSDRGYRHVQARCVALRRSGLIPYHWIADMSRRGYFVNTYDDAGDFLRRMGHLYRADLWRDSDYRCEVWAESRSIASVILDDCPELAVDMFPCGGFSSLSFIHEAMDEPMFATLLMAKAKYTPTACAYAVAPLPPASRPVPSSANPAVNAS